MRRGFTLAEAMLILVVMGVVAATVVPNVLRREADTKYRTIVLDLEKIDAAKQEAAYAHRWSDNKLVSIEKDLVPKYLPSTPSVESGQFDAHEVQSPSTFNGKSADEWRLLCANDPNSASCTL